MGDGTTRSQRATGPSDGAGFCRFLALCVSLGRLRQCAFLSSSLQAPGVIILVINRSFTLEDYGFNNLFKERWRIR